MNLLSLSLPALRAFAALSRGARTNRDFIACGVSSSSLLVALQELCEASIARCEIVGAPAARGRAPVRSKFSLVADALPAQLSIALQTANLAQCRILLHLSSNSETSAKTLAEKCDLSYSATRDALSVLRERALVDKDRIQMLSNKFQHSDPNFSTSQQKTAPQFSAQHAKEQRPALAQKAVKELNTNKTAVYFLELKQKLTARGVAPAVAADLVEKNAAECELQLKRLEANAAPGKIVSAIRGCWRDAKTSRETTAPASPSWASSPFTFSDPAYASEETRRAGIDALANLQREFQSTIN